MHIETYCGREVHHVENFGGIEVCMLPDYRTMGCPKYFAFHRNGKLVKTFHQKRPALRWAKQNQKG